MLAVRPVWSLLGILSLLLPLSASPHSRPRSLAQTLSQNKKLFFFKQPLKKTTLNRAAYFVVVSQVENCFFTKMKCVQLYFRWEKNG